MKLIPKTMLRSIHCRDEGDVPVGTLLVVALIVLPLLFILISFRENIVEYFTEEGQAVMDSGAADNRPENFD
jgi:hypothetical protein